MRIDVDTCRDPDLLASEVRRLRAVIAAGDCPDPDNATNHDGPPGPTAQPDTAGRDSGNAAGTGSTLTDAEREAIEAAARIIDGYDEEMDGFPSGAAATLRRLLERLD